MKISIKDVIEDLGYTDIGCCWCGSINKKTICFDNDERGNGNGPSILLKFYKDYARFSYGDFLTKKEKGIKFLYKKYDSVESFTEDISDFTRKYFKSIGLCRK